MSETTKPSLFVPREYLPMVEDLRKISRDSQNPNKMTQQQKDSLWLSLQSYGWIYPVVTNADGLLADGEQRVDVCLEHGEFFAPVLRDGKIQDDAARRILREVLNKLKGTHDKLLDAQEFQRISDAKQEKALMGMLGIGEKTLERYKKLLQAAETGTSPGAALDRQYLVIVAVKDELEQKELWEQLTQEGYDCRTSTL